MSKAIAALSLAATLAIATATVPAFAQSPDQKPVAAKKHQQAKKLHPARQRVAASRRGSRHIACTFLGCQPVPANCYPVTEYNWDGAPTGFDAVACR